MAVYWNDFKLDNGWQELGNSFNAVELHEEKIDSVENTSEKIKKLKLKLKEGIPAKWDTAPESPKYPKYVTGGPNYAVGGIVNSSSTHNDFGGISDHNFFWTYPQKISFESNYTEANFKAYKNVFDGSPPGETFDIPPYKEEKFIPGVNCLF